MAKDAALVSGITKQQIKARIAELQAELEQLRAQVAEREGAIAELMLLLQKKEQTKQWPQSS